MGKQLDNLLISASAGSGKTYRLTTRFLHMVLSQGDPTRALALTFSRATAGEFLHSILKRLASAADDALNCKELNEDIQKDFSGAEKFTQETCRVTLRKLVAQLHQLNLATIDSFFNRALSVFPMEFGLAGGYTLLSEHEQEQVRHQVLGRLLRDVSQEEADRLAARFGEAHKGKAQGSFYRAFVDFVKDNHSILMEVGDDEKWGNPERLWLGGCPYHELTRQELECEVRVIQEEVDKIEHSGSKKPLETLAQFFSNWNSGEFPKISTLVETVLANLPTFLKGVGEFTFRNKVHTFSPEAAIALGKCLSHALALELGKSLARTRGHLELLREYEKLYRREIRERGLLTFTDLPILLQPSPGNVPALSLQPTAEDRLWMDYRLDAHFDHWFFDEFQDTSNLQWNAVQNLASEAAQGSQDGRSLFAVGDPKQAIYAWRGGDHTLFQKMEENLGKKSETMDVSWRSVPAVLDFVNGIFENVSAGLSGFNSDSMEEWKRIWKTHESAEKLASLPGVSRLYMVKPIYNSFGNEDYSETVYPLVVELLNEVQPWRHGWECAILVSKNDHIAMVVDALRCAGIEASGDAFVARALDNPATSLLYSFIKWVVHPSDEFCHQHLRMSPFGPAIDDFGESCRKEFLDTLTMLGIEAAIEPWTQRLDLPTSDTFSKSRVLEFLDLCRRFDDLGRRDADAFLRFVEYSKSMPTGAGGASVKVMTIHRSKGATFDMTVVLGLDGNDISSLRRNNLHVGRHADRTPKWVLELPSEGICQGDSVLREAYSGARAEASYENLCKLYVGLTRARYGLYVIAPEPSKSSPNFSKLLQQTLELDLEELPPMRGAKGWCSRIKIAWESPLGDGFWFKNKTLLERKKKDSSQAEVPAGIIAMENEKSYAEKRLARIEPSRVESDSSKSIPRILTTPDSGARQFGIEVHALLARIDWVDGTVHETLKSLGVHANNEVLQHVEECLRFPAVAELFKRPTNLFEVWLEKPFLTVLIQDDREVYCSGVMDRVVLHFDDSGNPISAEIIDFKSDREPFPEKHRGQMETYRRVLEQLIDLQEDNIHLQLVFTRTGEVVRL